MSAFVTSLGLKREDDHGPTADKKHFPTTSKA